MRLNHVSSLRTLGAAILALSLAGCASLPGIDHTVYGERPASQSHYHSGSMKPYVVNGTRYSPNIPKIGSEQTGAASWYGPQFNRQMTSDGERFDMDALSAAHKTLPLPSIVEVTNLDNGRRLRVRVNDRGPFVSGRILDLSRGAARALGVVGRGTARVRLTFLGPADPAPGARIRAEDTAVTVVPPESNSSPSATGPRLQLGAYSDPENARRRQASISGARIEKRNGLYVVILGPFVSDEDASARQLEIESKGQGPVVLAH